MTTAGGPGGAEGGSEGGGFQFACLDCAMDFYSAAQLKRHTQYAHGREETAYCQVTQMERLATRRNNKFVGVGDPKL